MRDELNFHRDAFDGRNRCKSYSPWKSHHHKIQCQLEQDHVNDHNGNGWSWTDNDVMAARQLKILSIKMTVVRAVGLFLFLGVLFLISDVRSSDGIVPPFLAYYLIGFGIMFFLFAAAYVLDGIRHKIKKTTK